MKKKKIIVYLRGGIGNQLFMYATARALSLKNDAELVVDDWSGFVRDKLYDRSFELKNFKIQARLASKFEIISFLFYRLNKRIFKSPVKLSKKFFCMQILTETDAAKYLPELKDITLKGCNWLNGLWQSPKYFEHYKEILYKELMPPEPISQKFLKLGRKMISEESVAVGIRLYEDRPKYYSGPDDKIKNSIEINNVLNKIKNEIPNAKFYIFCTKNFKFLDELRLPENTLKVTAENGFEDTVNTLWLLSQCKHHVITNSSFYWWGAWLSNYKHNKSKQMIFAFKNFSNKNIIPENWITF
jgi:hypothetical protein